MTISQMKWIDRYAGYLLCWIAGIFTFRKKGKKIPKDVKKVLVIKFFGMGSLILSLPVFKETRKLYPNAKIAIATLGQNENLIKLLGIVDDAHYLNIHGGLFSVFFNIIKFWIRLYKSKPDIVLDLEYLTRFSALCALFTKAPLKVGFHSWDIWRGNIHDLKVPFNPYWHASRNFLHLLEEASQKRIELNRDFSIPESRTAKEKVMELLKKAGKNPKEKLIIFNPNASTIALERRWPPNYFSRLINSVDEAELGFSVLIGSKDEKEFVEKIFGSLFSRKKVLNLAGELNLEEFIELLRMADLLVTNDSGPLHFASLLNIKTLSFFGPETPLIFGPLGEGHKVLYLSLDCSPCITVYNAKTVRCLRKEPECLSSIPPEQALSHIKDILEN